MITYLKCPNCSGIMSARDNETIVQCATCGKKYVNPNFRDASAPQSVEKVEKKVNCKNCGKSVSESFEFCPYCGAQLKTRCRKCGNVLREEDLFCSRCGAPTKEVEKQDDVVLDEQNENEETAQETAVANIDVAQSDRVFEYADKIDPSKKSKRPKYSKKAVLSVVKNAICLTLCILLFAFAFCPIMNISDYKNIGYSGADFIDIMGATANKYDKEIDAKKLEKMLKEVEELQEELNSNAADYVIDSNGRYSYKINIERLQHKVFVETLKYSLSIKDNNSEAFITQVCVIGAISLVYIIASGAMLVASMIALVFSIINARSNGKKELKFWNGYHKLMVLFLFLSIVILFVTMQMTATIPLTMIFRLLFECIAVAFVMADELSEKGARRQAIFKVASIALCIIVVGVCFAPCFTTSKDVTDAIMVSGKEKKIEYNVKTRESINLFLSNSISKEIYDTAYKSKTHEEFLSEIELYVKRHGRSYYEGSNADVIVKYVFFDKYTYNDSQDLAIGYYLTIAVLISISVYACLAQYTNKGCAVIRRIVLIATILLLIGAMACGGVMCSKVNKYMDDNDIVDFKMSLDAGLICATLFAISTVVCDFLPNSIEKKRGKKEQLVQVQE